MRQPLPSSRTQGSLAVCQSRFSLIVVIQVVLGVRVVPSCLYPCLRLNCQYQPAEASVASLTAVAWRSAPRLLVIQHFEGSPRYVNHGAISNRFVNRGNGIYHMIYNEGRSATPGRGRLCQCCHCRSETCVVCPDISCISSTWVKPGFGLRCGCTHVGRRCVIIRSIPFVSCSAGYRVPVPDDLVWRWNMGA